MKNISAIEARIKELYYNHSPYLYIKMQGWSLEKLIERKEKLIYWMHKLHDYYGEAAGDTYKEGSAIAILECQYHDVDEEIETQEYYLANPSPTRKEFAIQNGLDVTNLE